VPELTALAGQLCFRAMLSPTSLIISTPVGRIAPFGLSWGSK
jgi:hypothetical protein